MIKIFIGTQEIAGIYGNMCKALQGEEIDTVAWFKYKHPFGYSDGNQRWNKFIDALEKIQVRIIRGPVRQVAFFVMFLYYVFTRNVFIFGFGQTFFTNNYDLVFLKLLRKKIILHFAGSDSRLALINGATPDEMAVNLQMINLKIKKLRFLEKYADIVIVHPLSSQLHIKKSISSIWLGMPFKMNEDIDQIGINNKIKILHAPSRIECKGTMIIRRVIENLQLKYDNIEYKELHNVPHSEVLSALKQCDLVIDELYSDTFMAGLATEAAFFGKPSVVGSYAREELKKFFHYDKEVSFMIDPENLESELEKIICDPDRIKEMGNNAKKFVHTMWSPSKVAQNYLSLINGNYDKKVEFDPQSVEYIYGYGLTKDKLFERIKSLGQDIDKINMPPSSNILVGIKKFYTDYTNKDTHA